MSEIEIRPATSDRFDDAERALSGGGDGHSCQCQWWTLTNAEWNSASTDGRAQILREEIAAGPPPALIAYVDGTAAGWVRVGPRTAQVRLGRTRAFTAVSDEPWDDPSVWAVSCFVVRKEHRGEGLPAKLLDAAIAYAREGGARVIEAYPIDTGAKKSRVNELFTGTLANFERAGFHEVARAKPHQPIVSLALD